MKIQRILTSPYAENCYVISDDNGVGVVIDPGCGAEDILIQLQQMGVKPVAILLTHGHFDHVESVNYLKDKYNLSVYANIYEKGILSDASKIYVFGGVGEAVKAKIYPDFESIREVYGDPELSDEMIEKIIKEAVENVNDQMPNYKRITVVEVVKEPFEKTTTKKIKRFGANVE